ncbi:FxSxx-COOH system tetratricopeptide repeat protein [Actinoplanes sp. NBRC 101535]|uniref:FxSxx-COOH system tetratricopeptide repeat protein n=1 Tax=Actinoplanes sp. NBRC 101535 TaxID=3032196 RepID=UPI00249FC03E|nr:FxSxx-COOH system tetratricopeptide repeat protein [Actinoplanes sp. NBRC 101535]GLY03878.1 hypothetical protein Acsp01_42570 [Actinoplanes sp. NBRC 101535]
MVTGSAPESLEDVLGGGGAAALRRWAEQEHRSVRLTNPRWTASGYTGSVLAAIVVSTPGEPDRQVIVKACPPGPYAEETGAHREALAHSDPGFFERHLVDLAHPPYPIDGGGRLMFQQVAGSTLDFVTLSHVADEHLPEACRRVVDGVIRQWKPTAFRSLQTTVGAYLRGEFDRATSTGAPVAALGAALGLAGSGHRYLRDGVGQMPVDIPNPLLMFHDETLAADLPIDVVVGLAHGDLHTENILIPNTFDAPRINEFRLVDLSAFRTDAPVTRDPVTLMLSVIAPTIADLRIEEQESLLAYVLAPWKAPPRLSALTARTLEAIHGTGFEAIRSMHLGDWRSQYLLSIVATALQFTSFSSVSDEGRWWFFRLAGNAGGEFLRKHQRYAPSGALTLRRPVSWPQPEGAAVDSVVISLDDDSRDALARLIAALPAAVLHRQYAEMVDPRSAVTQPNWADPAAVVAAVARDIDAVAGMASLLIYAERLAHASSGGARLQLHSWLLKAGRLHYPQDRLRELCSAVSRLFPGEAASTPARRVGQSAEESPYSRQETDVLSEFISPGGPTVLTPSSVSSPTPQVPVEKPRPIRGGLPQKNPDFTGRESMLRMLGRMLDADSEVSVVPQALHGQGGVGKTQLAAEFAYRHADQYWLVWWMTAESATQVRGSFAQLAQRLGIPVGQDMKQTSALVIEALSASPFRWLLVYDNVENPETLTGLVPSTGAGHVIVTSRNNAAWSARGNAIEVDVFEREESVQLIQRRGRTIDDGSADLLAEKLGDLPLALEQAANWHATTGMPIEEYLELLDVNLEELLSEGKPIDYPQTLYVMLKLAMHRLRAELPAAAELLELFAHLGPVAFPVSMLRAGRGSGISENLKKALDRPIELNRAIREIRQLGLAKVDEGQRIEVHRLTQRVLRTELVEDRLRQARDNAQRMLAYANPGYPEDRDNWPVFREIAPHLEPAEMIDAADDTVRLVVVDQIRYFFVIGDYEASRSLAETVVERWTTGAPGPDDELTLIARRHLANACRLLGETDRAALLDTETFERLLRDPRFGEDHEYTLNTANNLGVNLRFKGEFVEALRREEDNFARHLRVLGPDEPGTWRAQNNLAVSLRHLGAFTEAAVQDDEIRQRWSKQVGDDDLRTLLCVVNLAHDYYGQGRYSQVLTMMRTVVPQYQVVLDPRHRDSLTANRTLAMGLRKCGFYAEARDIGRQSYRDTYTRFGPRHEHTLAAMVTFANALRCCDRKADTVEARTLMREAVDGYRETFSAEHPLALAAKVNLAVALRATGDHEEARQIGAAALEGLTARLGAAHPYTLAAASGQVEDLFLAGMVGPASELASSVHQMSVVERGADHPDTLGCALNAALLRMECGEDGAQALFDTTLKDLGRVLGAEHPATLDAVRGRRPECDIEPPQL